MAFSCAIGATVWLKISWPERKTGCDVWEVPWVPRAPYNPANEITMVHDIHIYFDGVRNQWSWPIPQNGFFHLGAV